jgi:hypothetical protein
LTDIEDKQISMVNIRVVKEEKHKDRTDNKSSKSIKLSLNKNDSKQYFENVCHIPENIDS